MNSTMLDGFRDRLRGRTILVSGGGSGIGRAAVLRLAAEGARVGFISRRAETTNEVIELATSLNTPVAGVVADLGSGDELSAAYTEIVQAIGAPDVLINNVAMSVEAPFLELQDEAYIESFSVNALAAVRLTRLALPRMLEAGGGLILNVGSAQAEFGWAGASAYSMSKGALASFSRQIANEFGARGIRSNTVIPGAVSTPMQDARISREGASSLARTLSAHIVRRLQEPDEVAAFLAFLASDEATFFTGADLHADGGTTRKAHSYYSVGG